MMSVVIKAAEILFKIALFGLLTEMIYEQAKIYIDNDDVSSLLFKKFQHHQEDIYPTFSICVVYYDGGLFKPKLGKSSIGYWKFIRGVGDFSRNFSNIDFDESAIDVRKMLQKYQWKSKGLDGKFPKTKKISGAENFGKVFHISYQNPNRICFSKNEFEGERRLIKYDLVKLDYKWLSKRKSECHIYIHHKGQLIRSLTKPAIILFGARLAEGKLKGNKGFTYMLRLRSNALDILRKRPDANERCDISLINDDQKWHDAIFQELQCIPTFMKRFMRHFSHYQLSDCNLEQYKRLEWDYPPYDNFEAAGKLYLPPCNEMSSIVTLNENVARVDDGNITNLILKFEYPTNYRETVNKRSFNVYDLWSQIGGVVGIIVGYSMAQIPETLRNIGNRAKYLLKPFM